jgi:hypothetical protein
MYYKILKYILMNVIIRTKYNILKQYSYNGI